MSLNHKHKNDKFSERWRDVKDREPTGREARRAGDKRAKAYAKKLAAIEHPYTSISLDGVTIASSGVATITATGEWHSGDAKVNDIETTYLYVRIRNLEEERSKLQHDIKALRESRAVALKFDPGEIMWVKVPQQFLDRATDIIHEICKIKWPDITVPIMVTSDDCSIETLTPEQLAKHNLKHEIDFMKEMKAF